MSRFQSPTMSFGQGGAIPRADRPVAPRPSGFIYQYGENGLDQTPRDPGPARFGNTPMPNTSTAMQGSNSYNASLAASMGHPNFFGPSSGNGQWSSNGSIGMQSSGQAAMLAGGPGRYGFSGGMGGMSGVAGKVNTGGGYEGSNNVNWGNGASGGGGGAGGAIGGNVQAGGQGGAGGGNVGSQLQSSQNSANAANEARYQQLLTMSGKLSDVQGQREDRNLQYGLGRVDQHAISSGLGNTTVLPTLERGVQDDSNLRRQAISDQGLKTSMGIIERKTDQGPDANLIAALAGRAGANGNLGAFGGGGGGTQYGPSSLGGQGQAGGRRANGDNVRITPGGGYSGTTGPYQGASGYGWSPGQNGIGRSGGTFDSNGNPLDASGNPLDSTDLVGFTNDNGIGRSGGTFDSNGNPLDASGNPLDSTALGGFTNQSGQPVDAAGRRIFQDPSGNWANMMGQMVDNEGNQI